MAQRIPLTCGESALVDEEDFAWLSRWAWCASHCHGGRPVAARGARDAGRRQTVYMHREIMGLVYGDGLTVDHINHDILDNRKANLRVVTQAMNTRWQRSRGGSSKYVGVTWDHSRGRWRAQIQVAGKMLNLGRYGTEREAALARDSYVVQHQTGHRLNLPDHGC